MTNSMFIPRGTILHENLATSYVLADALVADLCEGGFSGVVEIMLRATDVRIVIARGHVAAAIESRNSETNYSNPIVRPYLQTTVADIAFASRRERGRISIYSYNAHAAIAIAERINAEPLYTRLSTEFADLEKMISKLSRERDRRWFVEVSTESGLAALVRIKEGSCLVLTSREGEPLGESETPDWIDNLALGSLLDECNRTGGVFDVYFKSATDSEPSHESGELQSNSLLAQAAALDEPRAADAGRDVSQAMMEAKAVFESLSVETVAPGPNFEDHAFEDHAFENHATAGSGELALPQYESPSGDESKEIAKMSATATVREKPSLPFDLSAFSERFVISPDEKPNATDDMRRPEAADLLLVQDDLRATGLLKRGSEADRMAEVKRLMGEIVKTIEQVTQSAEQRDSFSIHLRAGQLKIAERYSFLDPFGAEFEYLAGEIVFVGHASPDEFIEGLTEALKFAVEAAAKSSAQPARLHARIADELEWLLKQQRIEFQQHGLDQSIENIISAITIR